MLLLVALPLPAPAPSPAFQVLSQAPLGWRVRCCRSILPTGAARGPGRLGRRSWHVAGRAAEISPAPPALPLRLCPTASGEEDGDGKGRKAG